MNSVYAFLSWNWAGVTLALLIAAIGWLVWRQGRSATAGWSRRGLMITGGLVCVVGGLLIITSGIHAVMVEMAYLKYPPPGKLVDVNGYNMHLLAEGPTRKQAERRPTLVWIPGAHSAGYNFYNMHKIFRETNHSIVFDRLSTGWSDQGPFPRTSFLEVEEMHQMLARAGENDPLVLVGHSYGGLLAALYAMKYPDRIAGLVLLDSGVPINWENPEAVKFMLNYSRVLFYDGLLQTFGIPLSLQMLAGGDGLKELLAIYEAQLVDVWPQLSALNQAAMNAFGTASILSEVGQPEFLDQGATIPGVLNDKPLMYITFLGGSDLSTQAAHDIVQEITGLDDVGVEGQIKGLVRNRKAMSDLSDQFHSVSIPDGASHNFPYERPEFVVEQIRRVLEAIGPLP